MSHLIVDLWCSNGAKFADLLHLEIGMVRVEPAVRRTDPVKRSNWSPPLTPWIASDQHHRVRNLDNLIHKLIN